jgi:hypothetical protein
MARKRPTTFAAFPADVAKDFARRAVAAEVIPNLCKICSHPNRETIDFHILSDASLDQLRAVSDIDYAPKELFEQHRDNHLMPVVRAALPSPRTMLEMPYPADDAKAKSWWYFCRFWAISDMAIKDGSYNAAIGAMREMRLIDMAPRTERTALPDQPVDSETERQRAIVSRFQNEPYRKRVGEDED